MVSSADCRSAVFDCGGSIPSLPTTKPATADSGQEAEPGATAPAEPDATLPEAVANAELDAPSEPSEEPALEPVDTAVEPPSGASPADPETGSGDELLPGGPDADRA